MSNATAECQNTMRVVRIRTLVASGMRMRMGRMNEKGWARETSRPASVTKKNTRNIWKEANRVDMIPTPIPASTSRELRPNRHTHRHTYTDAHTPHTDTQTHTQRHTETRRHRDTHTHTHTYARTDIHVTLSYTNAHTQARTHTLTDATTHTNRSVVVVRYS